MKVRSKKFQDGRENMHLEIYYRQCAAMVLFNEDGQVLVAERNDITNAAWQLPQGGVEEGETIENGALRELKEEIGTSAATIISIADKAVSYDWPKSIKDQPNTNWVGQLVTFVALKFTGTEDQINLNTSQPEFRAWKWVSLEEIPELIVPFKRPVYDYAVSQFIPIRDKLLMGQI